MALKKSNDIFLLTLVDFLIQVIFFSLFIFVAYQALMKDPKNHNYEPAKVAKAIEAAGVSNLTELTDELTKMAPVTLKGFNESLGADNDAESLKAAAEAIQKTGGAGELTEALNKLAKLERGSGKPSCVYETRDGERKAKLVATAVGSANSISFTATTPEFDKLLASIGLHFSDVQTLSLSAFKQKFAPVLHKYPDCRYTIILRETTQLVSARDAVQQIFYAALRR